MFAEDLTPFFNTAEFADDATLGGVDVAGIYDKQYVVSGSGMGFTSTRPAFTMAAADIAQNPVGQALIVDGLDYKVAAIDPDGSDRHVTVLLLELA